MSSPDDQPTPATSFSAGLHRHGRSKAQICLFKILHIISRFPAVDSPENQHDDESGENRGFDVDRNVGLRAPAEIELLEPPATAEGGAGCTNCVSAKNDLRKSEFLVVEKPVEEKATEHSEISHVGDRSSGIRCDGVSEEVEEKVRDEGYLGLLIEAAQLILGDDTSPAVKSSPATAEAEKVGETKRKQQQCWTAATEAEWYAEFEDTSPVVKSKRGRSQVLPFKYRDSVVEPLVRWPASRHRSNLNGAVMSKRRTRW